MKKIKKLPIIKNGTLRKLGYGMPQPPKGDEAGTVFGGR